MSKTLRLHIDATLAEISGTSPSSARITKRWYIPKLNLRDGVEQFLTQNPEFKSEPLLLTTSYAQHILEKRAGESPALLVTSGFESWPFIRQPASSSFHVSQPLRTAPLISSDLVFGVTERTTKDGVIEKAIDPTEIEFLISKLGFTEIKNVALGFLHSTANSQNEEAVSSILKEKGFDVTVSSQFASQLDTSIKQNEVARWWRTFIDAYLNSPFEELLKPLKEYLESQKMELKWGETGIHGHRLDSLYSAESFMHTESSPELLASYHRIGLASGNVEPRVFETKWGPVLIRAPQIEESTIQPTTEIGMNLHGSPDFLSTQVGLDPGPMLLGRSLRLTWMDFVSLETQSDICGFSKFENAPAFQLEKAKNALGLLARTAKASEAELKSHLTTVFSERMRILVERKISDGKLKIQGPLAIAVASLLEKGKWSTKLKLEVSES